MRLLFVGGTSFVGRHAVEAAVADGHDVVVFHRGRTNDDLLAGRIVHLHGDRRVGAYSALEGDGSKWDAVIDVSAYVPRHVHQLADAVAGRTGHYVHISSISAYADDTITASEDSPVNADLADPSVEEVTNETYGPLKAMCERAGQQRFGDDRTAVIRPTYVAGPHDPTDRFTYWARRMARGGDVAVVRSDAPLQVIDARDLGRFIVRCAESAASGQFDAVGPWAPLAAFLSTITPSGVEAELVEVDEAALEAAGTSLPLLSSEADAWMARPGERAVAAGLSTRPLAETAEATRAWDRDRGEPALKVGPSPEEEAALLTGHR
jgi:2'-hydroxyisoflavone reductase